MTSTHTPGPWYATTPEAEGIRGARRIKTSAMQVADCDVEIIFAGVEAPLITAQDAALIAAAPDLLAALQSALVFIDAQTGVQRVALQDACRAAIAKATGGAA